MSCPVKWNLGFTDDDEGGHEDLDSGTSECHEQAAIDRRTEHIAVDELPAGFLQRLLLHAKHSHYSDKAEDTRGQKSAQFSTPKFVADFRPRKTGTISTPKNRYITDSEKPAKI